MPRVAYARPTFCSIGEHSGVLGAIERDQPLVEVDLIAEGPEAVRGGGPTAQQYVNDLAVASWAVRWHEMYALHHPPVGPSIG
jgi:hypothetical protein